MPSASRHLLAVVGLVAAMLGTSTAWAQDTPPEETPDASDAEPSGEMLTRARAHHETGLAALSAGHFEVAETNFRAALAIAPRASTAYNLALVLYDRGDFSEALGLFDGVLAEEYGVMPVDEAEIRMHREQAAAAQAQLTLTSPHREALTVAIDGEPRGVLRPAGSLRIGLDPGEHEVRAHDESGAAAERSVSLSRGEQRRLELTLASLGEIEPPRDDGEDDSTEPERRRWPIAVGITVALVVVGGAVALGLALRPGDERFSEDPIPNVEALRFGP